MYSDLFLQQQTRGKFPRVFIVAIVALFGLVIGQVFIWYANVPTRASGVRLIQQIPTNISDTEASIFFQTSESVGASILYGESPQSLNIPAFQAGDKFGTYRNSKLHLITISNLRPETNYYYKIVSDGKIVTSDGEDAFSFLTQNQKNTSVVGRQPVYGKVITPDGSGLGKVFVVVHVPLIEKRATFLTVSKDSGEWLIALPTNLSPNDTLEIDMIHEDFPLSHIKTVVEKSAPTPQSIVIGTDYTFTAESDNVLPASTRRVQDSGYTISLLYPTKDAIIPNFRPLFKGFGIPQTKAIVRVNSRPPYEGNTIINAQGTWVVEASRPFSPGNYTLAVDLTDNLGQIRTITRSFTIAKSGEQVLGESNISTPSGTMTPTRPTTPSQSPTQPTVITATPMPTGVLYITATPNPTIFNTVTPTELEKAGGAIPLSWLIFGSIFLSSGIFLLRFYPSTTES